MKKLLLIVLIVVLCLQPALAENAGSLILRAQQFADEGDMTRALACLDLAALAEPDNVLVDAAKAAICLKTGDTEGAEASIQNALGKDPLSADVWLLRCRCDILKRDVEALEQDLLYAELCGARFDSGFALEAAEMYMSVSRFDQAAAWYECAGTADMTEETRAAYAEALKAAGRGDEAAALGLVQKARRDEKLADSFASGSLRIKQAAFNWSACRMARLDELELPEGADTEEAKQLLDEFGEKLRLGECALVSMSPTGDTALVDLGGYIVALHDGVIRPIFAHWQRGLGLDELNQPYTGLERFRTKFFGFDGVVWSHNGRYAVLTNYEMAFIRMYPVEPVLLDVWTGDEIIIESSSNSAFKGDWRTIANACFAPDDSALFYTLYGHTDDSGMLYWLTRCDLEDLSLTRLQGMYQNAMNADTYLPGLHMLSDGSLIALSRPGTQSLPWGVTRIAADGSRTLYPVGENGSMATISRKLMYSENSGWALMRLDNTQFDGKIGTALVYFRPETLKPGEELKPKIIRIPIDENGMHIQVEDYDPNVFDKMASAADAARWMQSLVAIIDVCLSPDGHYALAAVRGNGITQALLASGLADEAPNGVMTMLIDLETDEAKLIGLDQKPLPILPVGIVKMSPEWNGELVLWPGIEGAWKIGPDSDSTWVIGRFVRNVAAAIMKAGSVSAS